ncbi:hypothetical protein PVK06_049957 [Gossypium arboreum]|uniref:Small ribosomal subunit protein uS14m n=2 Tax=Mesangiospermae TaxID=1437183 RepID=A0ABR0M9H6_GOSAR|nr:hypothetical protein PVK06_049957 [Gossypium arboreum]
MRGKLSKMSEKRNIRDHKRRLLAAKYELRRKLYKAFCKDPDLPSDMRDKHRYKLSKLPRNSSFARVRNRCISTGRPRSVYEFFRISRIVFRGLASRGRSEAKFNQGKGGLTFPDAESSYSNLAMLMEQDNKMISPRVLERRESGKNLSSSVTEQSDDSSVTQDDPFGASFAVYPLHPSKIKERIVTGVFLAMHYTPHVDLAFNSVEHVMRDVEGGWLLRYMHANGASWIGCQPVEAPFVTIGQISPLVFFLFFAITPILGRVGRGIPNSYTETEHA